jgi:hypothetical protein
VPGRRLRIVSGYALTLGLLLVPSGRVGDARGRRAVFITDVGLFGLVSAVCGVRPHRHAADGAAQPRRSDRVGPTSPPVTEP